MTASTRRGGPSRPPVTAPLDGLLAGLRLALFPAAEETEADIATLSAVTDWHAVAALAWRHHVAGRLLRGLQTHPSLLADAGIESALRALRDRAVRRGWRQLGALEHATDRLAASGIPCLVLKGLPLSQRLYGHPLVRDALDIDLLVAPETQSAAERVLLDHGWRPALEFPETPARNRWHGRVAADRAFMRGGAKVELHPRLCHNPHYFAAAFDDLWARSASVNVGTAAFRTLGEDDEFVYLACHGTRHGWLRLDWLSDVAAILARMAPARLERVAARCREQRLEIVLSSTLRLCKAAFRVEAPAPSVGCRGNAPGIALPTGGKRAAFIATAAARTWHHQEKPAPGERARGTIKRSRRRGSQLPLKLALKLVLKPDLRYVLHEMSAAMIAPRDWARIDLPDKLFFLYFPLRPLLWLASKPEGRGRAQRRGFPSEPVAGEPERTALRKQPSSVGDRAESLPIVRAERPRSQGAHKGNTPCTQIPSAGGNGEAILHTKRSRGVLWAFVRAPVAVKVMALEAVLLLLLARLLVKYVPMRRWRHRLATAEEPGSPPPEGRRMGRKVARVVRRVAWHVPFRAVCLPQAMAAQWMLRRRGIPSRLFFGARRRPKTAPPRDRPASGMDFHAWLTVSDACVLGGAERDTYVALPPFDNVA